MPSPARSKASSTPTSRSWPRRPALLTCVTGLLALSGTVILHEGSTIVVVLNALRLLHYTGR